jgi:hypothetical protein
MPGPDPQGIDINERPDGSFTITAELWRHGNRAHRLARMLAISKRIKVDGWRCPWCGEPVPLYRRADANYCGEGCRSRAARARKLRVRSSSGVSLADGAAAHLFATPTKPVIAVM